MSNTTKAPFVPPTMDDGTPFPSFTWQYQLAYRQWLNDLKFVPPQC